jgi:acyl-coenzyme A synthetase/AMP-(fatty) acid ligase
MGDLGQVDAEGRLRFFDRAADVIVRDGPPVSSIHVEHALHWHPDVIEAAAFSYYGGIAAAVVLRSPVPVEELMRVAGDRLDRHERPDRIIVADSLPHGPIGKVLKRTLSVA